jgi:hypothetical protein
VKANEVTKKVLTQEGGHRFFCGGDTVVISVGARSSQKKMMEALDGKVNQHYTVGYFGK